jgi:hypothetical protein
MRGPGASEHRAYRCGRHGRLDAAVVRCRPAAIRAMLEAGSVAIREVKKSLSIVTT